MEDGLVLPVDEGTPQGGPLSPLLSNLRIPTKAATCYDLIAATIPI
jgi:retron-type reverse transcriptase